MAFALYSDTTGLDAGQTNAAPLANRVWSSWGVGEVVITGSPSDNTVDGTISVQVRNGRFLVHLGEALADDVENTQVEIPDTVFNNTALYVVTWVAQDLEGGDYSMFRLPAQKLETVPHAVTAKRANGFEVMGTLEVNGAGPHRVNGTLEVVDGHLTERTSITRGGINATDITVSDLMHSGRLWVNGNATITGDLVVRGSFSPWNLNIQRVQFDCDNIGGLRGCSAHCSSLGNGWRLISGGCHGGHENMRVFRSSPVPGEDRFYCEFKNVGGPANGSAVYALCLQTRQ